MQEAHPFYATLSSIISAIQGRALSLDNIPVSPPWQPHLPRCLCMQNAV